MARAPLGAGKKGPALKNFVFPRSVPPGVPVGGVGWVPGIVSGIYGAYSEGTRLKRQRVYIYILYIYIYSAAPPKISNSLAQKKPPPKVGNIHSN